MLFLKQSTAVTVKIGPFLDSTDGNTEENALTISQSDVLLSKNGGAFTQKTESTACTVDGTTGMYGCPLDATDTGTLGRLQLLVHESGALAVWHEYMVVTANIYDSLCSTDVLQADLTQISGVAQSATDLKDLADTGYDPSTHKVQGLVLCDTTTTNTDMVDVSSLATILADTNELQTDWTNGGRLDLLIDAIKAKTDVIGASVALESGGNIATILADTNELQTDWTNGGRLDLLIDAIKAKTDVIGASVALETGGNLAKVLKIGKNKWAYSGTSYVIYDDDGVTPLYSFTLDSATAPTSRTPV